MRAPDGAARMGATGLYGEFSTPATSIGETALGPMDAVCIDMFGEVWVVCDKEDMASDAANVREGGGERNLIVLSEMAQDNT